MPSISVVMPAYNAQRYVREAIESILEQSYGDLELIVIDDASNDGTVAEIEAIRDPRIRLFRNESNLGNYPTTNKGIALARGRYLVRHDSDDVSMSHRFQRQVDELDRNHGLVLVSSEYRMIDEHGEPIGRSPDSNQHCAVKAVPWHLLFYNHLGAHSQVMMRLEDVRAVHGYPTRGRYSQDYGLWFRLADRGEILVLPDVLLEYRRHSNSITERFEGEQLEQAYEVTRESWAQLVERPVSLEGARALRAFYVGRGHPPDDRLYWIETVVSEAFDAYTKARDVQREDPAWQDIRSRVGLRFAQWSRTLARRRRIGRALAALVLAWRWWPASIAVILRRSLFRLRSKVAAKASRVRSLF